MQKRTDPSSAMRRKYPEPVVLVTTRSQEGKPNVMAVGWMAMASSDPMMFVLGIDDGAYTYELIRRTKEFVVAFPHDGMAREVLHVGSCHGRDQDKFRDTGLAVQKGDVVKAPLIADAVANFECRLVTILKPGDCPLVVGKIVAAHENVSRSRKRLYTIGPKHALGKVRMVSGKG